MHTRRASSKLLFAMYVVLSGGSSKSATTHGASSAALRFMVATCADECTVSSSAELAILPCSLLICRTMASVIVTPCHAWKPFGHLSADSADQLPMANVSAQSHILVREYPAHAFLLCVAAHPR